MRFVKTLCIIMLIILVSFSLPVFAKGSKTFNKSFSIEKGTTLTVKNINGDIDISEWDKDTLEVKVLMTTKKSSAEFDKVEVKFTEGKDFVIEVDYKKKSGKVDVNLEIKVPAQLNLKYIGTINGNLNIKGSSGDADLTTVNGNISASNINGYISAGTVNGNVDVFDNKGVVSAKTINGNIQADLYSITGKGIELESIQGNIQAYLKNGVGTQVYLKTFHGTIVIDGIEITEVEETSSTNSGKTFSGGPGLKITTINGNVTLENLD